MLAVQTADHLRYVPQRDIASITPVYPNRSRVVLADGTVAHRPGHTRWLNPDHLTSTQTHWHDPAGYLYPYQPLPEVAEEEEESALDPAVCWLERVRRQVFWHTDSDVVACENPFDRVLKIYPELCPINRNQAVSLGRLRRIVAGPGEASTLTLDTGAQLVASPPKHPALAQALGCDTLKLIDADDSPWLAEVRDTPYDMLTTTADRLRADFPDFRRLVLNLLWRSVLLHQSGQLRPTLKSSDDLFFGPVSSLAKKLGYPIDQNVFENTFKLFISREELGNFRQLGFVDPGPQHRHLGGRHPDTVLLAPLAQKEVALAAAERVGMSCYLAQGSKRLHLEFFAQALLDTRVTRIRLLAWRLDAKTVDFLREDLEQCDLSVVGPVLWLDHLDQVPPLQPVPPPQPALQPDASSRLALQCERGLLLVEPGQIASWMPARPSRWRVVSADGSVAYHPGPVPPGPWLPLGPAWVRPQLLHDGVDPAGFRFPAQPLANAPEPPIHCGPGNATLPYPADQILRLERRDGQVFWHLEQGRQIPAHLPLEEAAQLHPGLLRLNHDQYFNRHRLRATYQKNHTHNLILDDGTTLSCRHGRYNHQLAAQLGLTDLFELQPDQQLLRRLQIRDYPYEIARAKAPLLKADFATSDQLIVNILWQAYCTYADTGRRPYADDFIAFFYMPLQATLYRAGYLTRAQLLTRSPQKDRLCYRFEYLLHQLVCRCRLFSYQQFGFKDANASQRILGRQRPGLVLLVEKGGMLEEYARQIQQEYGLTLLLLGGMPSLRDSEYFERALAEIYQGPLDILAYTDFDNSGWKIGSGFVNQMQFLGRPCRSRQHVVQAACFSPQEQALYAHALPTGTPEQASNVANWVRQTGGVGGLPLGIHANWLQPYPRVLARIQEMLPC